MNGDFCDQDGARKLKMKIEEYWASRGFDVSINLIDAGFVPAMRSARTDVRSNMVNGMPPRKKGARPAESVYVQVDHPSMHVRIPDEAVRGSGIEPWGVSDYTEALTELAAGLDLTLNQCARRYGVVSVPESDAGWRYHPSLGFAKNLQR